MNISKASRYFLILSVCCILFTFFTMLLGPIVRAADAGLACPDWPLCKGEWIPEMDYQVFLEWLHRAIAGILGFLVLAWAAIGLFYDASLRQRHAKGILIALFLLAFQVILGALTITKQLNAHIVSTHLLNALLFWSILIRITWKEAEHNHLLTGFSFFPRFNLSSSNTQQMRFIRVGAWLLLVLVLFQIFAGVRVSTNQAGLVCNTFPACYEEAVINATGKLEFVPQYFPPMKGVLEKHMSHRFMGYLLFISLLAFLVWSYRCLWPKVVTQILWTILALVLLQIIIGACNVIFALPFGVTILHSFIAYIIYFSSLLFLLLSYRQRNQKEL